MEQAIPSAAEKRRLTREVKKLVTKWSKLLGLGEYQIRVSWGPAVAPDDPRANAAYASSHSLSEYRSGHLYFNLNRIPPHEDLEQLVVHELVHFMLGPLQDSVQDFVEAVPEDLRPIIEANVERAVERTCTDIAITFVRLVAGKPFGRLHFDEKESAHGSPPPVDPAAGSATRRSPRGRPARVRGSAGRPARRNRPADVSEG